MSPSAKDPWGLHVMTHERVPRHVDQPTPCTGTAWVKPLWSPLTLLLSLPVATALGRLQKGLTHDGPPTGRGLIHEAWEPLVGHYLACGFRKLVEG